MAARCICRGHSGRGTHRNSVQGVFSGFGRHSHMTRARITNAIAALLVIALVVWIAVHTYWAEVTVSGPQEGEAARNPYYSIQHFASAVGIRNQLIASIGPPPPRSGVLLVNGIQDDFLHSRVESLTPWVESGGRLVITDD